MTELLQYVISAVATGGAGRAVPPLRLLVPPRQFGLLKTLFLKHHATTRQQTMMEEEIITFKHNSPSTFSRFFAKLLATNCCLQNLKQYSVLLTRLYGRVTVETCKPAESLPVIR